MRQQRRDRLNALIGQCRARVKQHLRAAVVLLIVSAMMSLPVMSGQVGPKAQPVIKPPPPPPPPHKTKKLTPAQRAQALVQLSNSFVKIQAGEFLMGSENGDADEKPVHRMRISRSFEMGKYEVTQAQWEAVMGSNPSHFKGANLPVEQVSWDDAQQFMQKLNARNDGYIYRLPTEAEWEYACRAGTTTAFAFGDSLSSAQANFNGNYPYGNAPKGKYLQSTAAIGSYQSNAWGLHNMHGNVWEWCQDWYAENYYAQSPSADPTGPSTGSFRVLRGGGWRYVARYCRSASRIRYPPSLRRNNLGFRLVRTSR